MTKKFLLIPGFFFVFSSFSRMDVGQSKKKRWANSSSKGLPARNFSRSPKETPKEIPKKIRGEKLLHDYHLQENVLKSPHM